MKIGNNGNLVLGPFDESTPCLMIVLMNCQTKLRINHLTDVKSVAILETGLDQKAGSRPSLVLTNTQTIKEKNRFAGDGKPLCAGKERSVLTKKQSGSKENGNRLHIFREGEGEHQVYIEVKVGITFQDGDRFNSCQVIYSQFGLAIHQNDHQARRRFVEWAQNEIAVVPDFHKRILFSDEAHFWLNGYVNKQNCRIWSEANPQVYVETPLHSEKLTVWCALWAGGILLQKR
ncbi:DUF4817 domain-containing protein [Trichonephila clavipes]|nr:DUF4817 domain-containing protein [Trichonephila clavipes]